MGRLAIAALAGVALVIGLIAVHVLAPQRSGVIAMTEVFEPYITLTAVFVSPFLMFVEGRTLKRVARVTVAVLLVVALARCAPVALSSPGPGVGDPLTVLTWNIEAGPSAGSRAVEAVQSSTASLVGLQELEFEAAAALNADPEINERFPNRVLEPEGTVRGVGLLSSIPVMEHQAFTDPPYLRALLRPLVGEPFAVFVVHPLPARFVHGFGLPIALDTTRRDADIATIRRHIDTDLAAGRSVLVLGDINTTEREPAYFDFSAGLHDAHLDAGLGPGFTWRQSDVSGLPFGLLRIDYVFASAPFVFQSAFTNCALKSDHCSLETTLYLGTQL